ncbi:unnamed protein product [Brugia timori]|uniref:CR-type domain-containing protein n=1 Tax=Brugia timori TaxID=42155 RepID=A0A0R3QIX7_9BILA|nr:unnamed protein product [Brugia timori]
MLILVLLSFEAVMLSCRSTEDEYYWNRGGKEEASYNCQECRGAGIKSVIRKLGSGLIQQMQIQCPDCNGTGVE